MGRGVLTRILDLPLGFRAGDFSKSFRYFPECNVIREVGVEGVLANPEFIREVGVEGVLTNPEFTPSARHKT